MGEYHVDNVVELRDIRGLSTSSVATVLGISENAAKIRLHRARKSLRQAFDAGAGARGGRRPARIVALPQFGAADTRVAG